MQPDRKLNIVCWAFPSWNGDYLKSTVQLMKELAVRHNVLYIDYSYTWNDVLFPGKSISINKKKILRKKSGLEHIKLENGGSIHVLSLPPTIPANWVSNSSLYSFIEKLNSGIVKSRIKHALSQWGFKPHIAINAFNPFFGNATLDLFKDCSVLYYCYDNIDATQWAARHGSRLEKNFLLRADGVIFTSEALQSIKQCNAPSFVVNNGVDLRNFEKHQSELVSSRERKVVGYTGTLDDRLDFDLLENLASVYPEYEFQFIGRILSTKADRLKAYKNVKFFGAKAAEELPQLMSGFDVGIIPFVKNEFTKNIYPMKVNEYLILGTPVVSTDFAPMNDLTNLIEITKDHVQFSTALSLALQTDNSKSRRLRMEKARSNSWEQKGIEFQNILLNYAS